MALPRTPLVVGLFAIFLAACASSSESPPSPRSPSPASPASPGSPGSPGWVAPVRGNPAGNNGAPSDDAPAPRPDALSVLQATLDALQKNGDPDAAARAVVPHLHKSQLDGTGANLSNDVRQFSFKKAHTNAGNYESPVRVTRTRASSSPAIGSGAAAENGQSVDYFIAKRNGDKGMPAPVTIFFPASGGPPKVAYLGSM